MIYESTIDNLIMLVRSVNVVQMVQLERFFRDADDAENVEYYVDQLTKSRILNYDEATGLVRMHGKSIIKQSAAQRRIHAFWVIANFGSKNVVEIVPTPFPTQFLFITSDNEAYDLTVCGSRLDAQLAAREWKSATPDGIVDSVNHIAIVRSREDGEALSKYGFDSCCVLDANKVPEYYEW